MMHAAHAGVDCLQFSDDKLVTAASDGCLRAWKYEIN